MWDLWWTKGHWDRFFAPSTSVFPCQFHRCSTSWKRTRNNHLRYRVAQEALWLLCVCRVCCGAFSKKKFNAQSSFDKPPVAQLRKTLPVCCVTPRHVVLFVAVIPSPTVACECVLILRMCGDSGLKFRHINRLSRLMFLLL
jgi:hypothetical protein